MGIGVRGALRGSPFVEEQATEQPREYANGEEEAGAAGEPPGVIHREATAWDDAMDVRMMGES